MTQKNDNNNSRGGALATAIALAVVLIGLGIYALTGIDITGGLLIADPTLPPEPTVILTDEVRTIPVEEGFAYDRGMWQVYFTAPTGSNNRAEWSGGIDENIAAAIDEVQNTLDIATFDLENEAITEAILRAQERGVRVRVVADDEYGLDAVDTTLTDLELADIPVVSDSRSALMHNKFMIMDGLTVWFGSMNYTETGTYRNNNNVVALRSVRAAEAYTDQFNQMFVESRFNARDSYDNKVAFTQNDVDIQIYFLPQDEVEPIIIDEISRARENVRFMAFSFTVDSIADAMIERGNAGARVQGVFETIGSETRFSELPRLLCAGMDVRQDGNPGVMHHKVIIIDDETVLTGSFNFSQSAIDDNNENLAIIRDTDMARLFIMEFQRVYRAADRPDDIACD